MPAAFPMPESTCDSLQYHWEKSKSSQPDQVKLLASVVHERPFLSPGVQPVREGGCSSLLAGKGFAVMPLAFYNCDDLSQDIEMLHLEYFEEAVNYLLKHPQVVCPGIGLLGISKGGELCVSIASFLKGITAAVIINGSIANVDITLRYKDVTLPPLGKNLKRVTVSKDGIKDIVDVLNDPLEGPDQKSLIPVERSDTTFRMTTTGREFYANVASKCLQAHGKKKPQIICYPEIGHFIELPFFPLCPASPHPTVSSLVFWGGEPRSHAVAQVDTWKQLQSFFHRHLGGNEGTIQTKLSFLFDCVASDADLYWE
nr:acyl-coenzyme A thioesterase 1-like [Cavia porcellus]